MTLSIQLPGDVAHRLHALAARTGRSTDFYITEAVREHLDDLEDLDLAERELKAVRAGQSTTVALEEVMTQYGMADHTVGLGA